MSSWHFHGGLITLCILLSCRFGLAADAANASSPGMSAPPNQPTTGPSSIFYSPTAPATIQQNDLPMPSVMALPLNGPSLGLDGSTTRKFYTISASLRETYDDNVNTDSSRQASEETSFSPSILVDFPTQSSDFSAGYTLGLTYYTSAPTSFGTGSSSNGSNGGGNCAGIQITHNFIAQYSHPLSDRFSLNIADQFQYSDQPDILQSVGTNFQNGPYFSNGINGTLTAQLTPLFSTSTTYSNNAVFYEDSGVSQNQNSVENTGTESFSYAIFPKVFATLGGVVDEIGYQSADRGYITYTGFAGGSWQILPTLSFSARGGGTYIEPQVGSGSLSPYAALTINWTLGARSTLTFDYAHSITPTDEIGANGQTSDRLSSSFNYAITQRLSCSLSGILTFASVSSDLTVPGGSGQSGSEQSYAVNAGVNYQYSSRISFQTGVSLSGVDLGGNNTGGFPGLGSSYDRREVYIGVSGTY